MPRAAFTYSTEPSAPIPGITLGAGGGCGATVGLTSPVVHTFPVGSAWQYVLLTSGTGFDRPSLAPLHMKHMGFFQATQWTQEVEENQRGEGERNVSPDLGEEAEVEMTTCINCIVLS